MTDGLINHMEKSTGLLRETNKTIDSVTNYLDASLKDPFSSGKLSVLIICLSIILVLFIRVCFLPNLTSYDIFLLFGTILLFFFIFNYLNIKLDKKQTEDGIFILKELKTRDAVTYGYYDPQFNRTNPL